ncbi:hypothetical protein Avbf_16043 [Armadillidium vulgare]|nr:hypothetical protein Avbf_16043 [Armadillidium vulgare]
MHTNKNSYQTLIQMRIFNEFPVRISYTHVDELMCGKEYYLIFNPRTRLGRPFSEDEIRQHLGDLSLLDLDEDVDDDLELESNLRQ